MSKQLLVALACAAQAFAPWASAQTPQPEIVAHLNGLDVEINPMGVPAAPRVSRANCSACAR